jgi:hypothetical protein
MTPRPPPADMRRGESLWGARPVTAPARPVMRLLGWRPIGKGALVGRARIRLPSGLEISDVGIFVKDGRFWAQLPAQQQRDAEGRLITDERGKPRYVSSIRWSTKELQDGFSNALIGLVREEYPAAFDGVTS